MIEIYGWAQKKYKLEAQSAAQHALDFLHQPNVSLSIKFVSKREIRRLNREFRQIDRVTDVLSFPSTDVVAGGTVADTEYVGDMALCLAKAKQQGKEYGGGTLAEIRKLVVHSVLHLFGYDHIRDEDYAVMNKKEQEIEKYILKLENK